MIERLRVGDVVAGVTLATGPSARPRAGPLPTRRSMARTGRLQQESVNVRVQLSGPAPAAERQDATPTCTDVFTKPHAADQHRPGAQYRGLQTAGSSHRSALLGCSEERLDAEVLVLLYHEHSGTL